MDMLAELRAIVGENNVLTEEADTAGYLVDWSNRFFGKTPAVVRPGNTEEVAQVLAWANRTARLWCLSRATRVWWEEELLRQRATRFCCRFRA